VHPVFHVFLLRLIVTAEVVILNYLITWLKNLSYKFNPKMF